MENVGTVAFENDISKVFKRAPKEYKRNIKPHVTYVKHMTKLVESMYDIPKDEVKESIKSTIKLFNPVDRKIKFNKKNEVGDMEEIEGTITSYIQDTIDNNQIIVPSLTTYNHPSEKVSFQSEFLFENVAKRAYDKKKKFEYKQAGDIQKSMYHDVMQKIRKIFNNSVSGAYGSKGTILNNYSAHYTLTSITRSLASIGNMTTESMVAGNKYFKDPEVTINYILAVIANVSKLAIESAVLKFNLYTPTAEDLMEMILYSSRWYWENSDKEKTISDLLNSLEPHERCAVMYCNDLWHLKKYNETFMYDLLTMIGTPTSKGSEKPLEDIKLAGEDIMNLVHHICSDDIKGIKVNYADIVGTPMLDTLAGTALKVMKGLDKYFILFRAFYTTDILPTSIAYIKDMLRDAIVLSDTDSTCGSYDKWVEWYYGDQVFHGGAVGIAAAVMTINTQVMDHHIKILSGNMNIDKNKFELLKMKNEFYWNVFVITNASKHYFADTYIQEGNVYEETEMELKGVHLIASSIKPGLRKLMHNMMRGLMEKVKKKEKINLHDYLSTVGKIEKKIISAIKNKDISLFKTMPMKTPDSYKNGAEESNYRYHTLWNDLFGDKYGVKNEPPYTMIKVPLTIVSKSDSVKFLDGVPEGIMKNKFTNFFSDKKSVGYPTLRIPLDVASNVGIPKELFDYVDYSKTVNDNLYALYMVLETLGFYKKPNKYIYELIEEGGEDGK